MPFLALAATATASPFPVEVIRQVAAPTDWTAIIVALSSLVSTVLVAVGGYLTYNQLRLGRAAATTASQQLRVAAEQVAQQADLESKGRTLDLIREIDPDDLQTILRTLFPTNIITSDKNVATQKVDAYFQYHRNLDDPNVDASYFTALNRISNYFDKADLYTCSLVVDQNLFLLYYAPLIIRLYATFRDAYYESPRLPPSEGLRRLAKRALGAYHAHHIGTPEPQFANLTFDE